VQFSLSVGTEIGKTPDLMVKLFDLIDADRDGLISWVRRGHATRAHTHTQACSSSSSPITEVDGYS
jgi:hypothetical protein